ncbi:hypothetical protein NA57DRAFT_77329 [Rhizodiscina lignyota]|uniref:Mitochondrial cytochrome c oxidase assembly factor n=1 Tax=Rhizodiscina lignyota TaxID=1504668 RepID=A0A9P4M3U1_9PEZI|nr:hypothetical protein NA57DRAFT_77329 [Rhizodiscina lignyota]
MAGPNLEVFKFGLYVLFPIGIMYYFGTNLDNKFSVPDFWPKPEQTHKIPYEREEIGAELDRLKARRLERRALRLEAERLKTAEETGQSSLAAPAEEQPRRSIMSYFKKSDG